MKRVALGFCVLCLPMLLSSCVNHTAIFMGRNTGTSATAKVVTSPGQNGGDIAVTLNDTTYTGRWVYVKNGGAVGFGTVAGFSGAQSASASGTMFSAPTQGNGSIAASAPDGSTLHCSFVYNEWSATGVGVCEDNDGEKYDLQIN